jgi:hypothetical protein
MMVAFDDLRRLRGRLEVLLAAGGLENGPAAVLLHMQHLGGLVAFATIPAKDPC